MVKAWTLAKNFFSAVTALLWVAVFSWIFWVLGDNGPDKVCNILSVAAAVSTAVTIMAEHMVEVHDTREKRTQKVRSRRK